MGKRKNEEQPEGAAGEFHVPKTKRSLGDDPEVPGDAGLDANGDADGKVTPAVGRTDDWGQTTAGSARSANGEAAAPGAAQPESPQQGNLVEEAEEDAPGRNGSAGDTKIQTHRGMGDVGDGPECPREAAGAAMALPGDTGGGVPAVVPGARREEEGEHGELGDTDENQEPPGARVVNAKGSECGAASERAAGGETRENGAQQPRATGTSDAESCGSPECLGVCAPNVGMEGGTTGAESTGKTAGEADAGQEETRGGETPLPGAGLALDLAITAGGSPAGERDGKAAALSMAGTDMRLSVCCEGTAEMAPAVTVTLAPTGTAEPPGTGTGTAEPTGTAETPSMGTSTAEPTGTAEPPGTGIGTAKPPGTTEPPGTGTSTAEPPGTNTAEPTGTTEPPSTGTGTAEPTCMGTGTAEPTSMGTSIAEPTSTTEPTSMGTSTAEPTSTTEPTGVGTGTAEPTGTGTAEPPGTAEPTGMGTGTAEPPGTAEPTGMGTGTAEPPGTAEPTGVGTGTAVGTETPGDSRVAREPLPPRSELLPQQPPPATDRRDHAEPAPPGRSHNQEPPHREDATDVICGLILELSNLNRLAMSTLRGLEMLRRPKPRQSRRPVPPRAGRWWKET